ncbi:MAG TPA: hypothetical protein VLB50_10505 [Ignavibacteriaceae bacterium]|nr:hypothetical protein [Ignavibacteriaceae bacterium]
MVHTKPDNYIDNKINQRVSQKKIIETIQLRISEIYATGYPLFQSFIIKKVTVDMEGINLRYEKRSKSNLSPENEV